MANMKKQTISSDNEFGKLIKIVVILVVLFLAFYLLTIFLNKKDKKESETDTPVTIQYDKILIGNILEQANDDYYVLVEKDEDKDVAIYEAYLSNYKSVKDALRVYYAPLNLPYNKKFIGDKTVTNITKIDDLRLKGTTLLKIQKGKIVKTWDSAESIKKYLAELTKTEKA